MSSMLWTTKLLKFINQTVRLIEEYDLVIFNGFNVFLSLLQTVIITKFLSQEDFGTYGFYMSLSQYLYVVSSWGFLTWGVNKISGDLTKRDMYFSAIVRARILSGGTAYLALLGFLLLTQNTLSLAVYGAFLIYCVSIVFSPEILYIAEKKIKSLVLINVLVKSAYLVIVFLCFILFSMSPQKMFFLFSLLMLITLLVLFQGMSFRFDKTTFSEVSGLWPLISGIPNFTLVLVSFIFASGPVIFSGFFLTAKYFAVVFASVSMIKMIQAAYTPMIQKILPQLNTSEVPAVELFGAIKKDIKLSLIFSTLCVALLWVFSPFIVRLVFSSDYVGLESAIRLFSLSLIPGLLSTILITQVSLYLDILKNAYWAIGAISAVLFSVLIYCYDQLSWVLALSLMLGGEYVLLAVISLMIFREIQKARD